MPDGDPRSTVHTRINPKAVHKLCNILFVMRGENMKKRILIGIVSFFTAIVCAISIAASDSVFKDVKPNSWYHDDVVKAYERGLIKGMTDDTFAPSSQLTRAEYITLLSRLHGASPDSENSFSDVSANAWYVQYVGWAVKAGIVNGYEDNTFRANSPVTREELMVMTARYIKYAWIELSDVSDAIDHFEDELRIASWAAGDVESMRRSGIVRGDENGRFNPKSTATRAEIATLINRLYDYAESFDRSPRIAGNPLAEYSLYSDSLDNTRLGEVSDTIKSLTGVALPISDSADGRVIAFEVDPTLRRLEYSITEKDGRLTFAVSTKYAAPYFARIASEAISARHQFVIVSGYTALGTYKIDEVSSDNIANVSFLCETDKNPLAYSVNDFVTFRVTLLEGDRIVSVPQFLWEYSAEDGARSNGTVSGHAGQFVLKRVGCSVPGAARLYVYAANRRGVKISNLSERAMDASVIFDFDKVVPAAKIPSDFNEYWDSVMAKLEALEPTASEFKICENISIPGYTVYDIAVETTGDPAYGHITVPVGADPSSLKIYAAFMAYGQPSGCGAGINTDGITITVNSHSVKNHGDDAYYRAAAARINGWGFNNPTREASYFLGMLSRDIMAIRFAEKQFADLWNGRDIAVSGGSMGGFQSIAVAGIYSKINLVSTGIPWMCDIAGAKVAKRLNGWRPDYTDGSKYYDSCYFATRIRDCRVVIDAGLGDYTCPPSGVVSLYNSLSCDKVITMKQCRTHGYGGGAYNSSFTVSTNSPVIDPDFTEITDNGCAVPAPDYSQDRTLTASEEEMKACAERVHADGVVSVTFGYSSDITSERLTAIIEERLTFFGLPAGYMIEVDADMTEQLKNTYVDHSDGDIFVETVGYTITDPDGGFWDATFRLRMTKDLTSAEEKLIKAKFTEVFDDGGYVISFASDEEFNLATLLDRILDATGYMIEISTPIDSIPTDGTPTKVAASCSASYSSNIISFEFTLRLKVQ